MDLETRLTINEPINTDSDDDDGEIDVIAGTAATSTDKGTKQQQSNILSKLSFSWLSPMFKTGYKRALEIEDLSYLPDECHSEETIHAFNKHWHIQSNAKSVENESLDQPLMNGEDEEEEGAQQTKEPNLLKALLASYGKHFYIAGPLRLLCMAKSFINIVLMAAYLSDAETMEKGPLFLRNALIYSFCIFLNFMIGSIIRSQYELQCEYTAIMIRSGIICACYDKVLKITNDSRKETTSGAIMTLITVDVTKISWIFRGIYDLLVAPIEFAIASYLLYKCVGWCIFVAVAIQIITISPIKAYTVKKAKNLQKQIMEIRDERMKIINECMKAIKTIKMYGWVPSFLDKITNVRVNEVKIFTYLQILYKSMWFYWELVPILIASISLSLYTYFGGILTVEKAFVSLTLFYKLRDPIQRIPGIILGLIDAKVSLQRVTKFLASNEMNTETIGYNENMKAMISCSNASFSWDDNGNVMALNDLNIAFKQGSITMIIGETGSGKSAFLHGLLGNLNKTKGSIQHKNKNISIGYSSQSAWIQNATIRQNICFGKEFDERMYNKVISICALTDDLKILPGGDQTEIGEKGINLSGGQRQRLSLARAVYSNADIFVFDDPLSAVDSNVANHIFTHCIKNYLLANGKTVILATHAIAFLKYSDNIVVMDKGNISMQGTFEDLMAKQINFTQFIHHHNSESRDETDDTKECEDEHEETCKKDDLSKESNGKLMEEEERNVGKVTFDIYKLYASASYGIALFVSFLVIGAIYLTFENIFDVQWLAIWSNAATSDTDDHDSWYYLGVYIGLRSAALIILSIQIGIELISRIKSAKYFHKILLNKVLNAPMSFFDTTPIGRIISRFSKDIDLIDNSLNESFKDSVRSTFGIITCIIVVCMVVPYLLIAMLPLYIAYYYLQKYFIATSRELKRLMSLLNAPIYSNFSETISGTKIINSFKRTSHFMHKNMDRIDSNQQARYASFCSYRWYSLRLDFISYCLVLCGAMMCAFTKPQSGFIGICLVMTEHITGHLNWFVNRIAQLEQDIVSVERIHQYSKDDFGQEQQIKNKNEALFDLSKWPSNGQIDFKQVTMRYRDKLPLVLEKLSFSVSAGSKVGIIGRTGAGKSSLFVCLLRLVEIENGQICIDDVDISSVCLQSLRSKICIIPQDPVLFTGNIRFNLDPFNEHSDDEMIEALKLSHCFDRLIKKKEDEKHCECVLDLKVDENGSNFSLGEKQLICLSRAIVRNPSILLLDEATSSVDAETDKLIQETIRSVFANQTILTIAHRIDTILDYDRILILDKGGSVIQYDSPSNLLKNENGKFCEIIQESFGVDNIQNVKQMLNQFAKKKLSQQSSKG